MKSSSIVFFCLPQFYEENADGVTSMHSSSVEMTLQPEPHKGRGERKCASDRDTCKGPEEESSSAHLQNKTKQSLDVRLCRYRGVRGLIGCVKDLEFDCKPQREVSNSL